MANNIASPTSALVVMSALTTPSSSTNVPNPDNAGFKSVIRRPNQPRYLTPPASGKDHFSLLPPELHIMIATFFEPLYDPFDKRFADDGVMPQIQGAVALLGTSVRLRCVYFSSVVKLVVNAVRALLADELLAGDVRSVDAFGVHLMGQCLKVGTLGLEGVESVLEVMNGGQGRGEGELKSDGKAVALWFVAAAIELEMSVMVVGLLDWVGREDEDWLGNWAPGLELLTADKVEVAKALWEKGVKLERMKDGKGCTGLHLAAEVAAIDTLRFMLEKLEGAEVNLTDARGMTPLDYACSMKVREWAVDGDNAEQWFANEEWWETKVETVRTLIEFKADINKPPRFATGDFSRMHSIRAPNLGTFSDFTTLSLAFHTLPAQVDPSNLPMLQKVRVDIIIMLLDAGAKPEKELRATCQYSATVLSWGLSDEQTIQLLEALFKNGFKFDCPASMIRGGVRSTALSIAASKVRVRVFKWLVEHGADPNYRTASGITPMEHLVSTPNTTTEATEDFKIAGRLELLRYMAERGYRFDSNSSKDSLLIRTLISGNPSLKRSIWCLKRQLIRVLLELGANPNIFAEIPTEENVVYRVSCSTLIKRNLLLEDHLVELIELICHSGGSIEALVPPTEKPLLHTAIDKRYEVLTKVLISRGSVEAVDPETKCTALHIACLFGNYELAETLIERGADVNRVDNQGRSSVHCAVQLDDSLMYTLQRYNFLTPTKQKSITKRLDRIYESKLRILTLLHSNNADMNLCIPSPTTPPTTYDPLLHLDADITIDKDPDERTHDFKQAHITTFSHLPPLAHPLRCPHYTPDLCTHNQSLTLHLISLGASPTTPHHTETGYISWLLSCQLPRPLKHRYLRTLITLLGPTDILTPTMPLGQPALIKAVHHDASLADPEDPDDWKFHGHEFTRLLLQHGADPWQTDETGFNAVMQAGCFGDAALAGLLCGDEREGRIGVED